MGPRSVYPDEGPPASKVGGEKGSQASREREREREMLERQGGRGGGIASDENGTS